MDNQDGDDEEEEEEDDELKAYHNDFGSRPGEFWYEWWFARGSHILTHSLTSRPGEFDENNGLQGGGLATFSLRPALHLLGSLDWEHLLSSASA